MVQTTCCGEGQECIVKDVSGLADPCMASCNVFYRLPDGSIWLLNKDGDGYLPVFVANDETKVDWNADPDSPTGIANRPFKAIGYGLKIDDSGNLVIDELVLPKPDWNETSTTSKDYIANKPFQTIGDHLYVEDGELKVCLEDHLNQLPNSTWNLGEGNWTFGTGTGSNWEILDPEADKPTSHILHAKPVASGTQQISNIPHPMWVEAGQVVTLAFDFKENQIPNRNSTLFALRIFPERETINSQANALWFENILHSTVNPDWETTPTLNFTRFTYTTTVPVAGWFDPVVYDSDTSGTHESWYRELMLIKGKECEMPEDWYPYFFDVPEQVQSDWNETDGNSPAFIKNKPTIPDPSTGGAHTITLEGSPLDLTVGDHTFSAYDSITEEMDFDFNVTVAESNWDDSSAVRRLMFLEDGIDKVMEVTTYRLVGVEYSLPENNFTIDGVMTYQNVGGTFVYTLKVSVTKGGGGDTSNFVTIDTDQTIESTKTWGEINTDGTGEHGQITTVSPDGTIHQLQKVAGSNEYSEVEVAYGRIMVTRYQSDGTPLRSSLFTEDGESRSTDRMYTNVPLNTAEWTTSGVSQVKMVNGIMVLHIVGAHPLTTIDGVTGGNIKIIGTLPPEFASLLTENVEFMWSNFGGGQSIYPGRLDTNGQVKLYIIPTTNTIVVNNRFSIYLPIVL